jgi:hypothetical protein
MSHVAITLMSWTPRRSQHCESYAWTRDDRDRPVRVHRSSLDRRALDGASPTLKTFLRCVNCTLGVQRRLRLTAATLALPLVTNERARLGGSG